MVDYSIITEGSELYHHGIKGQKWGVRRYQNTDGSLTEAGKKRINEPSDKTSLKEKSKKAAKVALFTAGSLATGQLLKYGASEFLGITPTTVVGDVIVSSALTYVGAWTISEFMNDLTKNKEN